MIPLTHYVVLSAPQADRSTPEKTLQTLLEALVKQDVSKLLSCLAGARPSAFSEAFGKQKAATPGFRISVANVKTAPQADGTLSARFELVYSQSDRVLERTADIILFRKQDSFWQIAPPSPEQAQGILQRLEKGGVKPGDIVYGMLIPFFYPEVGVAARKAAEKEKIEEEKAGQEEIQKEIGRVGRLVDWDRARSKQVSSPSVLVGQTLDAFRASLRLKQLQALKENEAEPYTQKEDGFTSAQLKVALTEAQQAVTSLQTAKVLMAVPHSTPIKVLDYRPVTLRLVDAANPLKYALAGESVMGIWQVEVLEGAQKGAKFWTDTVVGMAPTFGDVVVVRLTTKPTEAVPVAVDLEAGDALLPGGRVGDAKALARFDRLVREKRFVLLPANTICDFLDLRTDGSCYLIRPCEGVFKGKTLFVRAEHAALKK